MQPAAWMTSPPWFLVAGLPWPEDHVGSQMAEAAIAIAPDVTRTVRPAGPDGQPIPLGHDLALLLDVGSRCAAALGKKVLFLSDITRWLATIGLSWERIGVNFASAQNDLEQQPLGLLVTVSPRAYTILCSTARNLVINCISGVTTEVPPEQREQVRASIEARLSVDWPSYITRALASVQPAALTPPSQRPLPTPYGT